MSERFIKLPWKVYKMYEKVKDSDKLAAAVRLAARRDFVTGKIPYTIRGVALREGWTQGKARRFLAEVIPALEQNVSPSVSLAYPQETENAGPDSGGRITGVSPGVSIPRSSLDIDNNTTPPIAPPKKKRTGGKRTAAPLLQDFEITEGMKVWFRGKYGEVPTSEVLNQTEAFLDQHRAKGNLFMDWQAAWRTWMTNWRTGFGKHSGKHTPPGALKQSTIAQYFEGSKDG